MTDQARPITSAANPRIKAAVKLRDRRHRDRFGLTLLEGYRELSRAAERGMVMTECFFCPELFLGGNEASLLDGLAADGVKLFSVTETILRKLAYRDRPEGLIAVAEVMNHDLTAMPVVGNGLYLVAEAIEKPGNLGSMLRSADAAGVDGLIICDKKTDIYNPNVIRASTGALFSVPVAEASNDEVMDWLRGNNIAVVAASPHAAAFYTDVDMTVSTAIVVGTEQHGLSDFWMNGADSLVKIPMLGYIDSLNVATATTILLYEAARQRGW